MYKHIGMLVSMMLVQAGGDVPFQMLSARFTATDIHIHDVPEGNIKEVMERVRTSFTSCM